MIRGFSYIYYMSIIHVSSDKLLNTIRIDGKIVNYLPLNLCLSCVTSSVVSPSTQSINLTETTHFATWNGTPTRVPIFHWQTIGPHSAAGPPTSARKSLTGRWPRASGKTEKRKRSAQASDLTLTDRTGPHKKTEQITKPSSDLARADQSLARSCGRRRINQQTKKAKGKKERKKKTNSLLPVLQIRTATAAAARSSAAPTGAGSDPAATRAGSAAAVVLPFSRCLFFFFSVRCRSGIGGGGAPGGLWSRGRRRRRVWSGATRWLRRRRGLGRTTTTSSSSSSSGTAVGDTTSSLDLAFPFPFHGEWCRVGFPAPRCWLDRRWIGPREQLGSCKGFAFGVRLCAWSVFHVNLVSVQPTIYIMPTCLVHTGRNYHYCALCKKKRKRRRRSKVRSYENGEEKKKWISWFSKFFLGWKNLGNGQLELQAFLIKLILRLFRQCARPSEKRCT